MKKIILFITFVICAVCAYSQTGLTEDSRTDTELNISNQSLQAVSRLPAGDAYKNTPEWGKYKALSTVGWTTFGVGMTATCVGGYLYLILSNINGSDKAQPGAIVFFSGLGLTAASVPVLVSAYHYRNKAKKIGLSMGIAQLSTPSLRQNMSYTPAMNFTITF